MASSFRFSAPFDKQAHAALARYPKERKRSAVLSLLDFAQRQNTDTHCVTPSAIETIAAMLDMTPLQVYEIASFYTMIRLAPSGRWLLQCCGTTPCQLCGAEEILGIIKEKLGIAPGETSKDGKFTLMEVECLGACVEAPVIQLNDDYLTRLTPQSVRDLLDRLDGLDKTEAEPPNA